MPTRRQLHPNSTWFDDEPEQPEPAEEPEGDTLRAVVEEPEPKPRRSRKTSDSDRVRL